MEAESQILSYALWPLLAFALATLWLAGLSNIWSSRKNGSFTTTKLAAMAVFVSLAAVGSFVAMEAALPAGWQNLFPDSSGEYCENPTESHVFSFGLERDWCRQPGDGSRSGLREE
jgi:hypothetical protein